MSWFHEVNASWGTAGFVVRRGEDTSGFVVYGPNEHLPRASDFPVGPLDDGAVLLAHVAGDGRTRRRLLVRMLRDLKHRGVVRVEAIASDHETSHHAPTQLLVESGWRPIRRGWHRGSPYTLVRTDLGSAVEVGELARGLVDRVKLPNLKAPNPRPGPSSARLTPRTGTPRASRRVAAQRASGVASRRHDCRLYGGGALGGCGAHLDNLAGRFPDSRRRGGCAWCSLRGEVQVEADGQ